MTPPKHCLRIAYVALIAISFAAPARSFADTFQIFNLGTDADVFFTLMNDSGVVVLQTSSAYETFINGLNNGSSAPPPGLIADDGTPCTPTVPPGGSVEHGVCNNGRDAFTGFLSSGQVRPSIYVGPTFQDIFNNGGEGFIFMNGLGDIVFDDHFSENWYEAVDLTTLTPEPGSIVLLATGLLALTIPLRRRLTS